MCQPRSAPCALTGSTGHPPVRRWCCCRAATPPRRCGGSTFPRCSSIAPSSGSTCSARPGCPCRTSRSPDPTTRRNGWTTRLAGLGLDRVHLLGVSIGGWTAVNYAVRRPGRAASLALLDPVMTFAPIPVKALLVSAGMFLPVPEPLQRRVFSWIAGGADVDESLPEAALISAGSTDYVLRKAMPKSFTDDQLRSLDIPVLALIAGRSVMLDAARAAATGAKPVAARTGRAVGRRIARHQWRVPGRDRRAGGRVLGGRRRGRHRRVVAIAAVSVTR